MSEDIERAGLRAKRLSEILKAGRTVPVEQVIGLLDDVADMLAADKAGGKPPSTPPGWVLVPVEPTPEILAKACLAAWPFASAADIELARKAAPIILMQSDLGPGFTADSLAAVIATMAPAYRAMISAAPKP